jgi:hypothetical protein
LLSSRLANRAIKIVRDDFKTHPQTCSKSSRFYSCVERRKTMILGMSTAAFTTLHVVISLIGIATGFIVAFGMIGARRLPAWNALFLATTALTSLTGFLFPFKGVTPGIVIGILSILILIVAVVALYSKQLSGGWRGTYVITAMLAQYFNFFVLIVQSFEKVPSLHALAPTGSEGPFKIVQLLTLLLFVALTVVAFKRFRVEPALA